MTLVGLEIGQCIKDMLTAGMRPENVECILVPLPNRPDENIEIAWASYLEHWGRHLWAQYRSKAVELFMEMAKAGKLWSYQEEMPGNAYPDLVNSGAWVANVEAIQWAYENDDEDQDNDGDDDD